MALNDASADPPAITNGGHHPLSTSGNASSKASTPVCNGQDPLTAASSGDSLAADNDEDATAKDCSSDVQQRPHVVHRANGSVVKQNGLLRNISQSSVVTDPQRLTNCHHISTLSSPPPLQPRTLCCQHCHYPSTLCCPCGQPDCPLFQPTATGPGPVTVAHPGTTTPCPCCVSACTYSHLHTPHLNSTLCAHQHHQQQEQRWQEHLHSHAHGPTIRIMKRAFSFIPGRTKVSCIWSPASGSIRGSHGTEWSHQTPVTPRARRWRPTGGQDKLYCLQGDICLGHQCHTELHHNLPTYSQ